MLDSDFPTVDPKDPYRLTAEEEAGSGAPAACLCSLREAPEACALSVCQGQHV